MKTPAESGFGSKPRLNIASSHKASPDITHVIFGKRGVVPKVKVKLLEPNPKVTRRKGLVPAWSRYYGKISAKLVQALIGYLVRQVPKI
jgi:hypothetical protein